VSGHPRAARRSGAAGSAPPTAAGSFASGEVAASGRVAARESRVPRTLYPATHKAPAGVARAPRRPCRMRRSVAVGLGFGRAHRDGRDNCAALVAIRVGFRARTASAVEKAPLLLRCALGGGARPRPPGRGSNSSAETAAGDARSGALRTTSPRSACTSAPASAGTSRSRFRSGACAPVAHNRRSVCGSCVRCASEQSASLDPVDTAWIAGIQGTGC